ncbi:LacI family DNA-binding transcriptional regulator [Litchfieldia salsa]|uniref:Transcriptional regulator, LacI family n=1 Tax=Litchfieldia salsa TaxID=930152 RepID=A0A1H0WRD1_9BACI|nr:LacI family DNA-binding transcriptional regulator [Litchfieldia salsa]SDP93260.1 transcriptional regulator, LacI family [Litchfieldia salsa]
MKPKIEDVAKHAGVSPTTVSRVLNNRGYISEQTRKKVQESMKELNYYPNEVARSLFIKRTFLIGLVFPTTNNPFYGQLIFHLENISASLGYKVLLCNSQNREDKEKNYLTMLQRNQVDGIIAGAHNRGIEEYDIPKLPIVGIDRNLSNKIPVVSSDNYGGGKQATQLLLNKGCKKIIHINGPDFLETPANLRRRAYEDVMRENHLVPITYEFPYKATHETVQEIIKTLFDEIPDVDGIFASDDLIASKVLREAKIRKIKIPQDLKVIGYDGTDTTRSLLPELSTVQQPIKEIAEKAVEILIQQINDQHDEIQLESILPVTIIDSETT